jgi:hypothetical protein
MAALLPKAAWWAVLPPPDLCAPKQQQQQVSVFVAGVGATRGCSCLTALCLSVGWGVCDPVLYNGHRLCCTHSVQQGAAAAVHIHHKRTTASGAVLPPHHLCAHKQQQQVCVAGVCATGVWLACCGVRSMPSNCCTTVCHTGAPGCVSGVSV